MNRFVKNACEEIDAAMFSGDEFLDENSRKELREYMGRWTRELKEWDEMPNDLESSPLIRAEPKPVFFGNPNL